jgi:hypothetical protein
LILADAAPSFKLIFFSAGGGRGQENNPEQLYHTKKE